MRCISPIERDRMPDGVIPEGSDGHASAAEVVRWIQSFQERESFDIRFGVRVTDTERSGEGFRLTTSDGVILTRRLIAATGEFGQPVLPSLPGRDSRAIEHVSGFDPTKVVTGDRVVIVGAGNSGVELAVQLDDLGASVVVSARGGLKRPPTGMPGVLAPVGFWLSGMPLRYQPNRGGCTERVPVESGGLWTRVEQGRVRVVGETTAIVEEGVEIDGGERVEADYVVFATGYQRDNAWLGSVVERGRRDVPAHQEGVATTVPGLGFVGIPCMRTWRSGFLRGFAQDAQAVVGGLP